MRPPLSSQRSSLVSLLTLLLLLLGGCSAPEPALDQRSGAGSSTEDCGRSAAELPDFTLVDRNETSPTSGAELTLSAFAGQVVVIYWAHAT